MVGPVGEGRVKISMLLGPSMSGRLTAEFGDFPPVLAFEACSAKSVGARLLLVISSRGCASAWM